MRIVLLTQDDPFYLGVNLDYLLSRLPAHSAITATVLFDVSPFGKRESFWAKAKKTVTVFGLRFFSRYAIRYLVAKLFRRRWSVGAVMDRYRVPVIRLKETINSPDSLNQIRELNPDLLVSIAGNQIFKQQLINLAPKGCLNLHSALLPKYRGLMPSFWVLKNCESETGVSVFYVDEGIDSGPILVQKRLEVGDKSLEQLIRESKQLGMDAVIEAVEKIEKGDTATLPNDNSQMTYFSFPNRADVIAFHKSGKRFY